MKKHRVTMVQFYAFATEYYSTKDPQRLGQAFCNRFNITDSDLFYAKDYREALRILTKYIVEE